MPTSEFVSTFLVDRPNDTQISSFGLGKVFIQVFTSPHSKLIYDFRSSLRSKGLVQLWPMPHKLNPFAKRLTKFPTKLVLKDEEADMMADAYSKRFDVLFGAKSVKRFRV
jgi:hypothetical protein